MALGGAPTGMGNVPTAGERPGAGGGGLPAPNLWAQQQARVLRRYIPTADYDWVKPSNLGPATMGDTPTFFTNSARVLGGGMFADNSRFATLTGIVATDLLTQPIGWSARGWLNAVSADYCALGLWNNANGNASRYVVLSTYAPYDATHLCIEIWSGPGLLTVVPTSFVPDRREHTYSLVLDTAGEWHALVDGTEVGSTVDIGYVSAGDRVWTTYSSTGPGVTDFTVAELLFAYAPATLLTTPDTFSIRATANKIGFIGDSYTAGSPDASYRWQAPLEASIAEKFRMANVTAPTFVNLGVGGDTSTDVLARLAAINAAACDHYFHLYGLNDNDDHGGTPIPPATTQANYTAIMNGIAAALPSAKHHVVSNMWFGSEQRPRGVGPHDATTDASNDAIVAAVALQPATRARYLNIIPRVYTSYSPAINPSNLDGGVLTQVDKTHPAKPRGQNVLSRCVWDYLTFAY